MLTMLGLLDTLIIGHTFCNMLSIQNELTMQKELQHVLTKMCFRQNSKTKLTTTKKNFPGTEF